MATKNIFLPLKANRFEALSNDSQYRNLNLNQSHTFESNSHSVNSKSGINNVVMGGSDKYLRVPNISKDSSFSWNVVSPKMTLSNGWKEADKGKDDKKAAINNSSTLSLHITAYENSVEGKKMQEDIDGRGMKATSKDTFLSLKSASNSLNMFELPRQQKDEEATTPEVMQFKGSQKMLKTNGGAGRSGEGCQILNEQPEWIWSAIALGIFVLACLGIGLAYVCREKRLKKHYYGKEGDGGEGPGDADFAIEQAMGIHHNAQIKVVNAFGKDGKPRLNVFMKKRHAKPSNSSSPDSSTTTSSLSSLFEMDLIYDILLDVHNLAAVIFQQCRYGIIAIAQDELEASETKKLSEEAKYNLSSIIISILKSKFEEATGDKCVFYGKFGAKWIVEGQNELMESHHKLKKIFQIAFTNPIELELVGYTGKATKVAEKKKKDSDEDGTSDSMPTESSDETSSSGDDPEYKPGQAATKKKKKNTFQKAVGAISSCFKPAKGGSTKKKGAASGAAKKVTAKTARGKIDDESFILETEEKASAKKPIVGEEIHPPNPLPCNNELTPILNRKHRGCDYAAKNLVDYLKLKSELRDQICDNSKLPKIGDLVESRDFEYKVVSLIGYKCFGGIYKVQNTITKKFYSMQCSVKEGNEELRIICSALGKMSFIQSPHFVHLCDHGKVSKRYNFIITTLAAKSVSDLIAERGSMSVSTAVVLAKQSLLAISDLHKCGMLHRDIKERNILIAENGDYHTVMLSGLGLTLKYESVQQLSSGYIVGSLKTGSVAGLTGKTMSWKEDYESWMYMICSWFGADLPWSSENNICKIVQWKEALLCDAKMTATWKNKLPVEIQVIMHECLSLETTESPNARWICETLNLILKVKKVPKPIVVDWDAAVPYEEPPFSKAVIPKNKKAYFIMADIHFKLIYENEVHRLDKFEPTEKMNNRKGWNGISQFRCAVDGCKRRILVKYDENTIQEGDEAVGIQVATKHTCSKRILFVRP